MKFLSFVQRLAFVAPIGCASSAPPTTTTTTTTTPTPSASTTSEPTETNVAGTGPCRCSWDTNASSAPRVCKKGEINYQGSECVPGTHKKYPYPIKGPLPPPDLPVL